MKQKEIYIDPSLNLETQKMIEMYFSVKTVSGIEGFVFSEEEFLGKYKNTYSFNDLRTSTYYAVYENRCDNCLQYYAILIRNRTQMENYLNLDTFLCNACKMYNISIERMIGNNQ